ncbi:alanine racemase [Maricaulis sp.]|uniref:alanine racemase n=1 Tax=Maricaulis sp. TaxID=1486257 RepID=UPI002B266354|nr:alanine racemase [Maricaulis sp.]
MTDTAATPRRPRPAPRLIIDLAAIQRNYAALQTLAPTATVGAVVKANGYGLGAAEVVPALADAGCRCFYVAHTSEAREAREALAGRPADIFVFNGFWPSDLEELRQLSLFPVINDLHQLDDLRMLAPDLPCAIHFDTGMSRLGLDAAETETLLADPARIDALDVRQIMSHLACADEPDHPLNEQQRQRFERIRHAFPGIPASLSNSAGVLLGQGYHFDMLRPGLALFSRMPAPGRTSPFEPVVTIDAPILQIRTLQPGDNVGYGASWTADRPRRVATVAAGYADGLLRAFGNGGYGRIGDARVPILGRVSMDLICVDIDAVDEPVRPGDPVRFLGADIEDMAGSAATISYEFLVRLGIRFDRSYLR